jgi:hypothetical protein
MNTLSVFDIPSKRIDGLTGVWTVLPDGRDSKIAAIGIYAYIYLIKYVYIYILTYLYMYICMYVYTCIHIYVDTYI